MAIDGEVRELHVLRPDRMKAIPGPDGWPEGYEYTAGGQSIRFVGEVALAVPPMLLGIPYGFAAAAAGQRSF